MKSQMKSGDVSQKLDAYIKMRFKQLMIFGIVFVPMGALVVIIFQVGLKYGYFYAAAAGEVQKAAIEHEAGMIMTVMAAAAGLVPFIYYLARPSIIASCQLFLDKYKKRNGRP